MSKEQAQEYRVLARKYRPQNFDELIGQEALVRTLKNAIESGRIAHAFMLTGVRGVGKTTTARIIAKSLNYAGKDGKSDPTVGDTSDCETANAIAEGRHPDVIEMDAASHTGVDDIRDIIDSVNYAPASARYKVYIIDEVHMLSKNAFNALLKTLEEPPAHVKFIFATTEIRKVPITVLSRCQRFDLRRIELEDLEKHFKNICEQESVTYEDAAITMIARAADGSVRDGLSILDQAIALSDSKIEEALVKDMLGLADKSRSLDLFEHAITGQSDAALDILHALHADGADPVSVIEDLLGLTHNLTKLKLAKGQDAEKLDLPKAETARSIDLALNLSMPALNKAWQIFIKGLEEVQSSSMAQAALEMVIIRLIYATNLPDPLDLIKKLKEQGIESVNATASSVTSTNGSSENATMNAKTAQAASDQDNSAQATVAQKQEISTATTANLKGATSAAQAQLKEEPVPDSKPIDSPETLRDLYDFCRAHSEMKLAVEIYHTVHLVKMKKGHLEIQVNDNTPSDFIQRLTRTLRDGTGEKWLVSISKETGSPTLAKEDENKRLIEIEDIKQNPVIKEIFAQFPNAEISDIRAPKTDEA